ATCAASAKVSASLWLFFLISIAYFLLHFIFHFFHPDKSLIGCNNGRFVYVLIITPARQIRDGFIHSLQNWTDRFKAAHSLCYFIAYVAGLQFRKNKNSCFSGHRRIP